MKFEKSALMAAMGKGRRDKPVRERPKMNPFLKDPLKAKGKPFAKNKMQKVGRAEDSATNQKTGRPMWDSKAKGNAVGKPIVRTAMKGPRAF